jgi:L-iditol 2-dehydrogenase
VAVYHNNHDLRLEERPVPAIGAGELLVKVRASGICGSDVMEWYRIKQAPTVLGHEIGGDVAEVGEGVTSFARGDRVFVSHHVPCGECRYCRRGHEAVCDTLRTTHFDPGGFAEYVRIPRINVEKGTFRLPEELSYEDGSMIEPLACVVRGQRHAGLEAGQSMLVVGSGIAGVLHLQLARERGAGPVFACDLSAFRREAALRFGADAAFAPEELPGALRDRNEGRLADVVIACAGAPPALRLASQCVERGGTLLFFAPAPAGVEVALPLFELWRDEVTLATSYAGAPRDLLEAIELIRGGRVRVREMITHRLSLDEAGRGFALVASAQDSLKVVLDPTRRPLMRPAGPSS